MKYIIELEDEPMIANLFHQEVDELWKAKGFNSLVFDKCGLDKLTPYTELDRSVIEDEVWKFLVFLINEMDVDDKYECFNQSSAYRIANTMSYQEAKARYEKWRQKEEIRVGDELKQVAANGRPTGLKCVVVEIDDDKMRGIGRDGNMVVCSSQVKTWWHKTGRHFNEVAELLKKMRGEE